MTFTPAKPALDLGFYSNDLETAQTFWGSVVGLPYEELLKVGGGVHQHRYTLHGAVLKSNIARDPLEPTTSGLVRLRIAADVDGPTVLDHPDGVDVELVPMGHDGVSATEVTIAARSVDHTASLLIEAFDAKPFGGRIHVGETLIAFDHQPHRAPAGPSRSAGFTYLTAQVFDVVAQHERFIRKGFTEGMAPTRLGDTAAISFVRLPDGDWLELSQRANLTGPLPDL
jgi:lactoylglutathione lyase